MSGETEEKTSGWTVDTLMAHYAAMRQADLRFEAERDRRYSEIALEREKALKIKDTADRDALELARQIQTYKDEKANELRSQIERERGTYVTQSELRGAVSEWQATIKPIVDYVSAQQGRDSGGEEQVANQAAKVTSQRAILALMFTAAVVILGVITLVANILTSRG